MEPGVATVIVLIVASLMCYIGYRIGEPKGQQDMGLLLSFFLGPIGLVITALLPDARYKCPLCKTCVPEGASRCRHCGQEMVPEKVGIPQPQAATVRTTQAMPMGIRIQSSKADRLAVRCPKCAAEMSLPLICENDKVYCSGCQSPLWVPVVS